MPATDSTSLSLLDGLSAGHQSAWFRFVQLYGPTILTWCRRAGLRMPDAEDVRQDVCRSVAKGMGSFAHAGPVGSFRGWLRAVTRNCVQEHHRRQVRQPVAAGGVDAQRRFDEVPDFEDRPDQEAAETAALIDRALGLIRSDFTEPTWEAFRRVTLDGLSPTEVGAALGMSDVAVRQAAYRVRRRLREELGEAPD